MLDKLFSRFRSDEDQDAPQQDGLEIAVAALLVEAAVADEDYTDKEKDLIDHMIRAQFSLDQDKALEIRLSAESAQSAASDMHQFSSIVKSQLGHDEKCQLIEDMWVIALSDADRAPYEEMIIRRLVGLIYLEDIESTAARRRAQERIEQKR